VFRERLAEACRARNLKSDQLCRSIGLGARRVIDLERSGLKVLEIYRLAQIADRLDVSIDWLLGRSNVMELPPIRTGSGWLKPPCALPKTTLAIGATMFVIPSHFPVVEALPNAKCADVRFATSVANEIAAS
jgi:hypothetical protein